jgi:hypothetical protein
LVIDSEVVDPIEIDAELISHEKPTRESNVQDEINDQLEYEETFRELRNVVEALERRVRVLEERDESTVPVSVSIDESNDLQRIDADDDLEASAIRTSLDDLLSPEEKSVSRLLRLMRKSAEGDLDRRFSGLVEISVFGRIPGGWWAWEGPEGMWGVIERDVLVIDGTRWDVKREDRIRVNVTWRPWHSVIESFDPSSLVRASDERVVRTPQAEAPPRFGNFLDELRPGHVVLAHVPYGPNAPLDMNGNTGKERRCVFMGWTPEGHALVRGVYTYEPGRYIKNLEGIELKRSRHLFSKPRVAVKRTIVEIYSGTIKRNFGLLDTEDLKLIGIQPSEDLPSKPGTLPNGSRARPTLASDFDSPLSSKFRTYVSDLIVRLESESMVSADRIGQMIVEDILERRFPGSDRPDSVVLMTAVGQVISPICHHFSVTKPSPFLPWFDGLISKREGLAVFKSAKLDGVFVVSRVCPPDFVHHSTPIGNTWASVSLEDLDTNEEIKGDDYVEDESITRDHTVRAVVMDQFWTHQELGDRRIDLRIVRNDLTRGDPSVETWLIAPEIPALGSFLQAAERSGWRIRKIPPKSPRERGPDLDLALGEILGRHEQGAVILFSNFTDIIGSVENLGWEVILETDIEHYVI